MSGGCALFPLRSSKGTVRGWWATLHGSVIANAVAEQPSQRMKSARRSAPGRGPSARFSRGSASGRCIAGSGIGAGDVVAFQLPNWKEAAVSFWAAAFVGATVTPIVHFYGAEEVDYILRRTRVRVLITADRFGRNDYLTALDTVVPKHRISSM